VVSGEADGLMLEDMGISSVSGESKDVVDDDSGHKSERISPVSVGINEELVMEDVGEMVTLGEELDESSELDVTPVEDAVEDSTKKVGEVEDSWFVLESLDVGTTVCGVELV
jgi:hypothetical protein